MNEAQPKGKFVRGFETLGTVTREMIEERAQEIARADGREEANDLDRTRAREDLTGSIAGSEPRTVGEPTPDWYTPRGGSSGEKAQTVRPENEASIPEKLVQEGIEEADHDQRSSSGRSTQKQK